MRYLDLSDFKGRAIPTAPSEVGEVLLRNRHRSRWSNPQASVRTLAVMVWPTDEMRRDRFLDSFTARYGKTEEPVPGGIKSDGAFPIAGRSVQLRELGAEALDHMDPEIKAAQEGWRNAGDLLLTLMRIDATSDPAIRRGASINKAKELINASTAGANRGRVEKDFSKYRDVAHLAAAVSLLAAMGVNQTGQWDHIKLITPVFADLGTVLCFARLFERFGLELIPWGRKHPILPSDTIWRVSSPENFPFPTFTPGSLSPEELNVLNSFRSDRGK